MLRTHRQNREGCQPAAALSVSCLVAVRLSFTHSLARPLIRSSPVYRPLRSASNCLPARSLFTFAFAPSSSRCRRCCCSRLCCRNISYSFCTYIYLHLLFFIIFVFARFFFSLLSFLFRQRFALFKLVRAHRDPRQRTAVPICSRKYFSNHSEFRCCVVPTTFPRGRLALLRSHREYFIVAEGKKIVSGSPAVSLQFSASHRVMPDTSAAIPLADSFAV